MLDLDALSGDQLRDLANELRRRLEHDGQRGGRVPDTLREAVAELADVVQRGADDIRAALRQIAANAAMYRGVATDPYEEIVNRLHLCGDTFAAWRTAF